MNNQLTGFNPDTKAANVIPLQTENVKTPWRALEFYGQNEITVNK